MTRRTLSILVSLVLIEFMLILCYRSLSSLKENQDIKIRYIIQCKIGRGDSAYDYCSLTERFHCLCPLHVQKREDALYVYLGN